MHPAPDLQPCLSQLCRRRVGGRLVRGAMRWRVAAVEGEVRSSCATMNASTLLTADAQDGPWHALGGQEGGQQNPVVSAGTDGRGKVGRLQV